MIEIIEKNWLNVFLKELKNSNEVLLISPFVTYNIVDHLIKNKDSAKIKLITRFDLNDFRSKVSSLSALKRLVELGFEIKGIKGLHSKSYIFDNKSVIIGSANFTSGGFFKNYEFGILSNDIVLVEKSTHYFESLWNISGDILNLQQISEWESIIKNSKKTPEIKPLPDFGKYANLLNISPEKKVYIKFYGTSEYRTSQKRNTRDIISETHCHWALTFSGKKGRPRKYNDGDVVYIARMLDTHDYAIFGRGIALRHFDQRDVASKEDIGKIDWKKEWPIYIRVKDTEFIDTHLKDCPSMNNLINELKYDCFQSTYKKHLEGEDEINPRLSLRRQADIELSTLGAEWLEGKFQEIKSKKGSVPEDFLSNLYEGTPSLKEILKNQI